MYCYQIPEGLTRFRWWWLRTRYRQVQRIFLHYPATSPAGHQVIRACTRYGYDHAVLTWKVCHDCRRGLICKISLTPDWQRRGLGAQLILRAMQDGPDYRWTTTGQSPDGEQFFKAMSSRTGGAFTRESRSCDHMRDGTRGLPTPRVDGVLQQQEPRRPDTTR